MQVSSRKKPDVQSTFHMYVSKPLLSSRSNWEVQQLFEYQHIYISLIYINNTSYVCSNLTIFLTVICDMSVSGNPASSCDNRR